MKISKNKIGRIIRKILIESKEEISYYDDSLKGLIDDPDSIGHIDRFDSYMWEDNKEDPGLDFKTFKPIKKLFGDIKVLGYGSFRTVFEIPGHDGLLLKVAHNHYAKGDYQNPEVMNMEEIKLFNKYPEFFPKVYLRHPDGLWFVVEKVESIDTDGEFEKILRKNFLIARSELLFNAFNSILKAEGLDHLQSILVYFLDVFHENAINLARSCFASEKGIKKSISNRIIFYLTDDIARAANDRFYDFEHNIEKKNKILELYSFCKTLNNEYYNESFQKSVGKAADEMFNIATQDFRFLKVLNIIKKYKIAGWDFRKENIGTDENLRFIILDGSMAT